MATPTIPPRPSRTQNTHAAGSSNMEASIPKIPPRPSKRSIERSVSPNRDAFAQSPLNDPAFLHNNQHAHRESHLSVEAPPRPPSVTLPSIGQEGSEYASFEDLSRTLSKEDRAASPSQTRNTGDIPLHAPKASVPSSTAKSRIQTVTRTDSSQAAALGIGKLGPNDKTSRGPDSGRSDSSAGTRTRPSSTYQDGEEEQGIPEIGVQVPMYPNAGDVQAPTPGPYDQGPATGVGFFNKGGPASGGRHHNRTKSGREIFHGPPGSYGLHGHGVIPDDDFEKSWYAKHPEDFKKEKAGEYGPHIRENRKDYHWVGDDLVKLVRSSGNQSGMGASREDVGTPDEHIGYLASEEYASRMASPRPTSGQPASISSKSGVKVESPLRQANVTDDTLTKTVTQESEADSDIIHVDPPSHRASRIGGGGYDPPTEDLGPEGGNTEEEGGWVSERGYGVPILASDEIRPNDEWRQPAVSPELERRGSGEFTLNDNDSQPSYITKQRTHSRSSSRNNNKLSKFAASQENLDRTATPLESTKEYEPLFPEDDEHHKKPKKTADKLKRPDLARHYFPSQDVWEDTPSSLQLQTTVETPQAPEEPKSPAETGADQAFEKPEDEKARKDEDDQQSFLPEHAKRFSNKHLNKEHLADSTRPGMQQRFPSHDIWEDAPDHGQLVATVSTPQTDDTNEYADDGHVVDKPTVPARPSIPARPQKKEVSPTEKKATPAIPERPKPNVPTRPTKSSASSSERVPTLESQSAEAPQPKAKPPVPARPGGSKIAALQAGFMKDLNSKLGLGPQAPKVKEPEVEEEEKEPPKPLQDARKGRAKGPQRRKPTSSPSPAAGAAVATESAVSKMKLEISSIGTIWSIADDGEVDVPAAKMAEKIQAALKVPVQESTSSPSKEHIEDVNDAKDIAETEGKLDEPLTKQPTNSETKVKPEIEVATDAVGGVPLEQKVSVDEPTSATTTEAPKPELQTAEPVTQTAAATEAEEDVRPVS